MFSKMFSFRVLWPGGRVRIALTGSSLVGLSTRLFPVSCDWSGWYRRGKRGRAALGDSWWDALSLKCLG